MIRCCCSDASALAAVRRVREEGFECGALMCLVFRGTEDDRRSIEGECRFEYVFRVDELAEILKESAHPRQADDNDIGQSRP